MAMSRSFAGTSSTTRSPISTEPALARSSPAMMLSSVDLPQPEGPTSTVNSPFSISRSMPFSTSSAPNRFESFRIRNAAIPVLLLHRARGQARQEIPPAEQIDEQRRQRRDQHRRTLHAVLRVGADGGAERDQGRRDRLLAAGGEGDGVEEL